MHTIQLAEQFINIAPEEVDVAIARGKLDFGFREQIFYSGFDGRKRKRALV